MASWNQTTTTEHSTRYASDVFFTSVLDSRYRRDLDSLLFFNANQQRMSEAILHVLDRWGAPRIASIGDRLRVVLDAVPGVQSLYALVGTEDRSELIGVVVFTRDDDRLVVLYVAVREDYSATGRKAHELLLLRIVDQLRDIGRRISGIESVLLRTSGRHTTRIPVNQVVS